MKSIDTIEQSAADQFITRLQAARRRCRVLTKTQAFRLVNYSLRGSYLLFYYLLIRNYQLEQFQLK